MGFQGGRILEPGLGTGLFVALMPEAVRHRSRATGIELDPVTAGIARLLYPQQDIRNADFAKTDLPQTFDLAIGNPPFSDRIVQSDPAYKGTHLRGPSSWTWHHRHFRNRGKGKDQTYGHKATLAELQAEIKKAEGFQPALKHWVFATTAPKEAELQLAAREISRARAQRGEFTVTVLGWEDICSLLADHPSVAEAFYPEHAFDLRGILAAQAEEA